MTHILKLYFEVYKKIFFITGFSIYKNATQCYPNQNEKKRSTQKISTSFWRRKRQKAKKDPRKISKFNWKRKTKKHNKNLSEEQKKKLAEYRRNY